jgi:hypothetical protein
MSHSTALLDADLDPYCDEFPSVVESSPLPPLRWLADATVAVVMVLLAPFLVLPLAVAFLIACIRMQQFDLRTDSDRPRTPPGESSHPVRRGMSFEGLLRRSVGERRSACEATRPDCTYRWN